ncbi:hypothetical protein [Moorena sp. SIO3E8]|uniref:hypothetical protein n=2 Tax=unclassified Moorena TaxID=2683338 RepID=UPI0013FF0F8C|nr:hypothetical protein [Moorena sp. SIO3E8]NEP99911.1 hypothetical protein [Moorena sp. SIO3F7]
MGSGLCCSPDAIAIRIGMIRIVVPCSLFPTPDSRLPIPDSRFPIPDSRFPIPDSRFPTPDSLSKKDLTNLPSSR